MPSQIDVSFSASAIGDFRRRVFEHEPVQYTQTGDGVDDAEITVGTTPVTVSFTNLATPSLIALHNLDDVAVVTWGPDSAGTMVGGFQLRPNRTSHVYAAPGLILKMQSDTAGAKVRVFILEA